MDDPGVVTYRGGAAGVGLRGQFSRYLVVGVVSVLVDSLVLVLLREETSVALWLVTTIAYLCAFVINFGFNMRWVFGAESQLVARLLRYLALVGVNYVVTLSVVLALSSAGVHYLASKWVAIVLCVVMNFFAYRRWVFA